MTDSGHPGLFFEQSAFPGDVPSALASKEAMELLLGISFLILLIVMALGLGRNRPKPTLQWTAGDFGWLAVVLLVLIGYSLIVYG